MATKPLHLYFVDHTHWTTSRWAHVLISWTYTASFCLRNGFIRTTVCSGADKYITLVNFDTLSVPCGTLTREGLLLTSVMTAKFASFQTCLWPSVTLKLLYTFTRKDVIEETTPLIFVITVYELIRYMSPMQLKGLHMNAVEPLLQKRWKNALILGCEWMGFSFLNRGYPAKRALSAMRKHGR